MDCAPLDSSLRYKPHLKGRDNLCLWSYSRSGPDELVAIMLAQLLQHGIPAHPMKPESVEDMLAAVSQRRYNIVCVSSSFSVCRSAHSHALPQLQASNPGLQIIVGLWDFEGGSDKARERLGAACPGVVTTTLSEGARANSRNHRFCPRDSCPTRKAFSRRVISSDWS